MSKIEIPEAPVTDYWDTNDWDAFYRELVTVINDHDTRLDALEKWQDKEDDAMLTPGTSAWFRMLEIETRIGALDGKTFSSSDDIKPEHQHRVDDGCRPLPTAMCPYALVDNPPEPKPAEPEALKPCPFCGEGIPDPGEPDPPLTHDWFCGCPECDMMFMADTKADAVAAWNRRADSEELIQARAEISELNTERITKNDAILKYRNDIHRLTTERAELKAEFAKYGVTQ